MKLSRICLVLITFCILPFILSKPASAVTFTIDTIDTNTFNPTTTPLLNWNAAPNNMLIMTGAATPDASISAKLDGGTGNIIQKTGFGFPTSRWSISFENLKTALYNVTLKSGLTTITFQINVTNNYYTGTGGTTVTPTLAPMQQLVTGDSDMTFMIFGAGVFVLFLSLLVSKRAWKF
jgi:hypothetical protein